MRRDWQLFAGFTLALGGLFGLLHAQSSLSTTYTTADAWDCAGGASCPKPIGILDGKNAVFTLRGAPTGQASVNVFLNGIRERIGEDYSLAANSAGAFTVVTFLANAPAATDRIDVTYRENVRANILPQ